MSSRLDMPHIEKIMLFSRLSAVRIITPIESHDFQEEKPKSEESQPHNQKTPADDFSDRAVDDTGRAGYGVILLAAESFPLAG